MKFQSCKMNGPWDLLYSTMSAVNNAALGTSDFKVVCLRLSVLTTKQTKNLRGHEETWAVMDPFIAFIVVVLSWVYVFVQTHQVVYIEYMHFLCVYQLYLNTVG